MVASGPDMKLFAACFTSLIATSFGFIVRVFLMDTWAKEFNLSATQKGEIFGVGLWPFAISIVLFSLIIDRIGYRTAMAFAFVCHVAYMAIVIFAPTFVASGMSGYWVLYLGSFIGALGNGTVEAVINPVVATMFKEQKTKWLNILHAGWPGGLVLGGILALLLGDSTVSTPDWLASDWRLKVGLVGLPVFAYGALMLVCRFPVNERVAAGVSFKDMLKEVGLLGAFLVSVLIVFELANVAEKFGLKLGDTGLYVKIGVAAAIAIGFGVYTMSLGRPLFVILMLIMVPLAITELGTDSWISDLMTPVMKKLGQDYFGLPEGLKGAWVLIYTSFIMMVLRFCAGPIVHKISPLGLLALSAGIAAVGLFSLSLATGIMIIVAATLYAFGKTFFWPTMLGVVSEQFPRGGALTLNAIAGLGMMAVGIVGSPLLGNVQDKEIDKELKAKHGELHAKIMAEEKPSVFGTYQPVDDKKLESASADDKAVVAETGNVAKKSALTTVAVFPIIMLVSYLALLAYFYTRGGYKPVKLHEEPTAPTEY
jgi:MFS family permease